MVYLNDFFKTDDLVINWFGVGRCVKKMGQNEQWKMTGSFFIYNWQGAKWQETATWPLQRKEAFLSGCSLTMIIKKAMKVDLQTCFFTGR